MISNLNAQILASIERISTSSENQTSKKNKPANYNSLGYNVPLGAKYIIVG